MRYCLAWTRPQWRQVAGVQWEPAAESRPMTVPGVTAVPTVNDGTTGSYVVRRGPVETTTTPRPASWPAYVIVPEVAARTGWPGEPARSTPRWPGSQGLAGRSKPRTTRGRGCRGQVAARARAGGAGLAAAAATGGSLTVAGRAVAAVTGGAGSGVGGDAVAVRGRAGRVVRGIVVRRNWNGVMSGRCRWVGWLRTVSWGAVDNRVPVRFDLGWSRTLPVASHASGTTSHARIPVRSPRSRSTPGWVRTPGVRRGGPPGPARDNRDSADRTG